MITPAAEHPLTSKSVGDLQKIVETDVDAEHRFAAHPGGNPLKGDMSGTMWNWSYQAMFIFIAMYYQSRAGRRPHRRRHHGREAAVMIRNQAGRRALNLEGENE